MRNTQPKAHACQRPFSSRGRSTILTSVLGLGVGGSEKEPSRGEDRLPNAFRSGFRSNRHPLRSSVIRWIAACQCAGPAPVVRRCDCVGAVTVWPLSHHPHSHPLRTTTENAKIAAMTHPAPGTPGGTRLCQCGRSSIARRFCLSSMVRVPSRSCPGKTNPHVGWFRAAA